MPESTTKRPAIASAESALPGGRLQIVGIGEDGWDGLSQPARDALRGATTILGSARQLELLPADLRGERELWPSPMAPRIDALVGALLAGEDLSSVVALASGDPMLHGLGSSLAARVEPALLRVYSSPSAYALACARLGWPQHGTPLVSRVASPDADVVPLLLRHGRAIVYVPGSDGARLLAAALREEGVDPAARFAILERLGGPYEELIESTVGAWQRPADALHLVALELPRAADRGERSADGQGTGLGPGSGAASRYAGAQPDAGAGLGGCSAGRAVLGGPHDPNGRLASSVPGLPDELYGGDGQLTRAEVRAVALAALAPRPGERLWDVGAGSGTIAIEWCRSSADTTAIAIESREDRADTIAANAAALNARGVTVRLGAAPLALEGLPQPDAIFIGGGPAAPGMIEACWAALRPGGRLVANAVTLEGETALVSARGAFGGRLVRLEFSHAEPLGTFTGWKPQRPVVQWSASKPASEAPPT